MKGDWSAAAVTHHPFSPHSPQSAIAGLGPGGLLADHRPGPIGFDWPSSAAKAWSFPGARWARLLAANREAGEAWSPPSGRYVTGLAPRGLQGEP